MKKIYFLFAAILLIFTVQAQSDFNTHNFILVTIDGLRWQEVFSGLDSTLLSNSENPGGNNALLKEYWHYDPDIRRKLLMPFLWETLQNNGQLYGNRKKGCFVNVMNPYWFSYPGYNEILCGIADSRINSNEYGPNPNVSVLEVINREEEFKGKVAAFASWNAFNDILNEERSDILVNAGFDKLEITGRNQSVNMLNKIQTELPDLFGGIRLDAVTFGLGFEYLKLETPRFLYLAFDETDDFGHQGRYDLYLNSAHITDGFLNELWVWIQSSPSYKNNTTMLITCDHGRGNNPESWRDHGSETPHSDETWFAVIGPDTPALGEVSGGRYYNNQYAKTIAMLLGIAYSNNVAVGEPIQEVMGVALENTRKQE